MERKVEQVQFRSVTVPKRKRVAAYARVSINKDAMQHSLAAQVGAYSTMIRNHAGWEYAGVYADYAVSGTKNNRPEFVRLLADCRAGKVDMIITKSLSRFARNTVTLLETVRDLKELGVDVYFEEQNIHTLSADGELMLTLLASFAQEESFSVSENMKWRIRKNFSEGKLWSARMLGYRQENSRYIVIPEEAAVVRRIFADYLNGDGIEKITNHLNTEGVLTQQGCVWHKTSVCRILKNYAYTGNLILQKTYRDNHITKKKTPNTGELPQYVVKDSHEAIISEEIYDAVQAEMLRRTEYYKPEKSQQSPYPFTGKITCANCGAHYRRKTTANGAVWICSTYNCKGKSVCPAKRIPESIMTDICNDICIENVTQIYAYDNNRLLFRLHDGSEIEKTWRSRSRSESWTDAMKQTARERRLSRA